MNGGLNAARAHGGGGLKAEDAFWLCVCFLDVVRNRGHHGYHISLNLFFCHAGEVLIRLFSGLGVDAIFLGARFSMSERFLRLGMKYRGVAYAAR